MPAAILLPQLRPELKKIVKYPTAPAIPPTITDVASGIKLSHEVYSARQRREATDEEVVSAIKYQTALLASDEGAEPAWFQAAMTRELAPIRAELAQLTNKVDGLDGRLKVVKASVGQIRRMAAITWNRSCGSGKDSRLEVVPFVSGDDPTTAPHNLPPLSTVKKATNLNATQCDAYYAGYHPEAPLPPAAERISDILIAIGVMV